MSNNVTSPIIAGTTFETEQQPDGSHRPRHSTPATDAILSVMNSKLPAISNGRMPVDIGGESVVITGAVTIPGSVEIANDSGSPIPVSATALPLPTGAATSVAQTTGNTTLASIDSKVPSKGQAVMASSTPVTIASDQTALPVTVTGVATAANQVTANTSLQALVTAAQSTAAKLVDTVVQATSANRSGTITSGNTAQQLMPANTSRRGFVIQNQSSGDLYINGIGTATLDQNSLKVPSGGYYETPVHHIGTGVISIIGAATGQAFYAREF